MPDFFFFKKIEVTGKTTSRVVIVMKNDYAMGMSGVQRVIERELRLKAHTKTCLIFTHSS